jgi:hypothetical protein
MSRASSLERLMLDLVNEERRDAGLGPLRLELRLNDSAEDHSSWMLDADRFSHTGKGGSSAGDRMEDANFEFAGRWTWGENIAFQSERGAPGLTDDVRDLHRALMDSPGHRANILNPDFELLGIGIERGDYRGYDAVMVTQNFAATAAPVRIDGGDVAGSGGGGSGGGGSGGGSRPPSPPAGSAPTLEVADFEVRPGGYAGLNRHKTYSDPDGDEPIRYEIEGPDDAFVTVAGRAVDVGSGHSFAAGDFGRVIVRFDRDGEDQTFRIRAQDDDGWSDWDSFTISSSGGSGGGGSRPVPKPQPPADTGTLDVAAADIEIEVGQRVRLIDHLDVTLDGDPAKSFQIQSDEGGPNLWMKHRGEIDASSGKWFGAGAMNRLYVEAGDRPGEREMRILVSDGDDRSDWDSFVVTTEWDVA